MAVPTPQEQFQAAAAAIESALAAALVRANSGTIEDIKDILKLIIKKEIVLELLLEEFNELS
jgi:hypothetical protein